MFQLFSSHSSFPTFQKGKNKKKPLSGPFLLRFGLWFFLVDPEISEHSCSLAPKILRSIRLKTKPWKFLGYSTRPLSITKKRSIKFSIWYCIKSHRTTICYFICLDTTRPHWPMCSKQIRAWMSRLNPMIQKYLYPSDLSNNSVKHVRFTLSEIVPNCEFDGDLLIGAEAVLIQSVHRATDWNISSIFRMSLKICTEKYKSTNREKCCVS